MGRRDANRRLGSSLLLRCTRSSVPSPHYVEKVGVYVWLQNVTFGTLGTTYESYWKRGPSMSSFTLGTLSGGRSTP